VLPFILDDINWENYPETFGNALWEIRDGKKRISRKGLDERVKKIADDAELVISRTTIERWEKGRFAEGHKDYIPTNERWLPKLGMVLLIAQALDCQPQERRRLITAWFCDHAKQT